jgi:hypothetical protein
MSPDPYGEFHSPYLAMGNNPVSTIDPDGGKTVADPTNIDYDNGRERRVDPFDMVGGSGTREEYYHFDKEGKLVQDVGRLVQIFELGYTASEKGVELSNTQDGYAYVYETKSGDLVTITTYNTGEFFVDGVMKERGDEGAQGGGDLSGTDKAGYGMSAFGFANGAKTEIIDYAVRSGSSQAGIRAELQVLGKTGARYLNAAKGLSKSAGIIGVAVTGIDAYNKGQWENHHTADVLIGLGTTFMLSGPWGWAAAGAYFLIDVGVKSYSGKSITENLFDGP